MKKISVVFTSAIAIALATMLSLSGCGGEAVAAPGAASDNVLAVEAADVAGEDLLAGKVVYLYTTYQGLAMSPETAAAIVAEMEESGQHGLLTELVSSGKEFTDSGVTFVTRGSATSLKLGEGAGVYVAPDGISLEDLNLRQIDVAVPVEERVTAFGSFTIYV